MLLFAGLVCAAPAHAGTLLENERLAHARLARAYDLYVPYGLDGSPLPLLFVLHGGTQSNDVLRTGAALRLRSLAGAERVVVAFPSGTSSDGGASGPSGSFDWNDCRSDAAPSRPATDATGFIAALIDAIAARLPIDPQRVCECVDQPRTPLSVLIMHGTADPIMPWVGGQVGGNRGLVVSAEATRDFRRGRLGTGPPPQHTDFPDRGCSARMARRRRSSRASAPRPRPTIRCCSRALPPIALRRRPARPGPRTDLGTVTLAGGFVSPAAGD